MTPHLHADIIKAWANGFEIEILIPSTVEDGWAVIKNPSWHEFEMYRVKPERKPNTVTWNAVYADGYVSSNWKLRSKAVDQESVALLRIEIDHNDPATPVLVSATLEKP